ncbi:unnamed protein product [Rhizophagus irregularis]|nr:unnamed protein product [Rhizophagus irregularis]
MPDIRVIVGLDFGTTYSGYTYCHREATEDIMYTTNVTWPNAGDNISYKTNTVLRYDDSLRNVESWGQSALSKPPDRRVAVNKRVKVLELFKLHLGNLSDELKEKYKLTINYKVAITDYLREIGKHIKDTIKDVSDEARWEIDFMENVLLVLTVPAEYTQKEKATMRKCALDAGLIDDLDSKKLEFTTEPEAAAIYCKDNVLKEHDLATSGTIFMIVDCGGVLNPEDSTFCFHAMANKGTMAKINEEFTANVRPSFPFQKQGVFEIYFIDKYEHEANLGDPRMKLLGRLKIDWPDKHLGINRPTTFKLAFDIED